MRSYAEQIRWCRDAVGRCDGIVIGLWLVVRMRWWKLGCSREDAGFRMEASYDGIRKRSSLEPYGWEDVCRYSVAHCISH